MFTKAIQVTLIDFVALRGQVLLDSSLLEAI